MDAKARHSVQRGAAFTQGSLCVKSIIHSVTVGATPGCCCCFNGGDCKKCTYLTYCNMRERPAHSRFLTVFLSPIGWVFCLVRCFLVAGLQQHLLTWHFLAFPMKEHIILWSQFESRGRYTKYLTLLLTCKIENVLGWNHSWQWFGPNTVPILHTFTLTNNYISYSSINKTFWCSRCLQ